MSAHAGIFYFDGRPVPHEALSTLAECCRPYGPDDGSDARPSPGVALLFHALRVTPEDEFESQPVALADGRTLTWDGRLDNRTDLMMALALPASFRTSDSEVVARACERWRDDAFGRLLGDWSLALWDPVHRHVTLAVDFMTIRSLHYVVTDAYCAWSTSLAGLVALTNRRTDFDDDYLHAMLIPLPLPGRTPYRGIYPLPGGHFVRLKACVPTTPQQYWHVPAERTRYRDRRDYARCLQLIFKDAVASRLRSSHPVWMELSGGLDSSSVVCMAARVVTDGGADGPSLATLSYITPGHVESDETRFMAAVSEHTGLPGTKIVLDHSYPPHFPAPVHPRDINPGITKAHDQMRRAGARTLLTGGCGDAIMGNFPLDLTSMTWSLRSARPLDFVQALRSWSLSSQRTAWQLAGMAVGELLPNRFEVARLLRETYSARKGHDDGRVTLLSSRGERALDLLRSTQATYVRWSRQEERPYVSRRFLRTLAACMFTGGFTSPPEAYDLSVSHPFLDRRVVEYMSSIPWSVVCEPGRPRALMRDAFGRLLPERVAKRFSKGYAEPFFSRRASVIASLLTTGSSRRLVVERGYVSAQALADTLEQARAGSAVTPRSLVCVGILESWLAQAFAERVAAMT